MILTSMRPQSPHPPLPLQLQSLCMKPPSPPHCLPRRWIAKTDPTGYFFDIVSRNPLPPNLLGISENLDALCLWMTFLRRYLDKHDKKVRFHLTIPAYRPMLIKDPLIFPEKLFPLTIQGLVHNSKEYV
ncbi:hypothetical protein K469DRAFT_189668 [Zopfia rhizophila CBS 207.26]|uniref:Uncharacterized protein n=1 Tax=Zopfia rhizophila CBS 207.26 TaxID=1314779 RepID=A0A6A6ES67_9PEZI|nr:hypothetical protein K469DRAFT_189668 [Zopfia rhizophila CBS 207.26]